MAEHADMDTVKAIASYALMLFVWRGAFMMAMAKDREGWD